MKGIACAKCGRAQVISDDWINSACVKLNFAPAEDSLEALLPKLTCKDCGAREPLLVWMEVIPTGRNASSGRVCVACGEFLTVARVEASPDAIRCVPCQSDFEVPPSPAPPPFPGTPPPHPPAPVGPEEAALFAALRSWRLGEATAAKIPAFCVLHNKTLLAVVAERPTTLLALQSIAGFGPHKLNRYGPDIIEIVRQFSASA